MIRWNSRILKEARNISYHTDQMRNGNLDTRIETDSYKYLKDLAEDIDQLSNTFNAYINEMTHILSHLSAGNMAVAFSDDIHYHGDFLPIKNALHKIRHSLNSSFDEIHRLSAGIDQLSTQVENGSSYLATNTSEQAALISNLTSTIYDITDKTVHNAENAKTTAKAVEAITRETETGRSYMDQLSSSVDKVKSSIDDISNIIELINGIAEQTKLLALNASIETARAGVNGKGFAVVAGEIKKLAQSSSDAVKETTQLINNGIAAADESAKITIQTVESFKKINDSIEGISGLCTEISELSDEQAENLKEVSAIITDISKAVQSSAAYAQTNSASAMGLASISSQLKNVLQRYRLMGQENVHSTDNNIEAKASQELTGKMAAKLFYATTTQAIDTILENEIKNHDDVECLYVIGGDGNQVSHTIMNPKIKTNHDENFKPAMPGDDYSSKKYFRQAMINKNEPYISSDYISKATGNLCKTISYAYKGADDKYYVICIDILCSF